MNLRDLHGDDELRDLIEAEEDRICTSERERRHGPVVDYTECIEWTTAEQRRRMVAAGEFDS